MVIFFKNSLNTISDLKKKKKAGEKYNLFEIHTKKPGKFKKILPQKNYFWIAES